MPEVNEVGPTNSWRLIHNDSDVLDLFESPGYTQTIFTIFESTTKEACEAEIVRLGLKPLPVELPPEEPALPETDG